MGRTEYAFPHQSTLLQQLFAGHHALAELFDRMREDYYAGKRDSCVLWLSGKAWQTEPLRVDHEFFLVSDHIGLAFSVHPEDSIKAALPACHPYQTEILFMLFGEGTFQCLDEGGSVLTKPLSAGEVLVIPPNQCHRFLRSPVQQRVYALMKTNLHREPDKRSCEPRHKNNCLLCADPKSCPLRLSFLDERNLLRKDGWEVTGHQPAKKRQIVA